MKKIEIQTDYLDRVFKVNQFTRTVDKAVKTLRAFRRKNPFDAIAFTGHSGAAIAYPLSYKLKIPLICIRKSRSDNHSTYLLEGCVSAQRYIIVDDFIQTGYTIKRIQNVIKDQIMDAELVGIFLYDKSDYRSKWNGIPII